MKNYLENQIQKLLEHVNGFGWQNRAYRNHQGTYLQGEPFDFCIITKDKTYVFDAKETISSTWTIRDKDIKQAINLSKCPCEKFFLIYFITDKKLLKLELDKFFEVLKTRKHIRLGDCVEFNYTELLK